MLKNIVAVIASFVILAMPIMVSAQYGLNVTAPKLGYGKAGIPDSLPIVIGNIVSGALGLVGILFFGMMMYAGLRWMTTRGQEELKEKAIHTLHSAILGLIVVVLSYALTAFILGRLVKSRSTVPSPQAAACLKSCNNANTSCNSVCLDDACHSSCAAALTDCTKNCPAS